MSEFLNDFDMGLLFAAINLSFAVVMGALIGSERQIRGRMAGLRTNALVSLGAAGFVTFAALFPDDINPTRVAAQVVSGIGFLGAGIIFRDGFNIQGINTAATLWCSAAVGMMAGTGHLPYAAVMTAAIVFINLALRPIVRWVNSFSKANAHKERLFLLRIRCAHVQEQDVRAKLLQSMTSHNLHLHEIDVVQDGQVAEIKVQLHGLKATENAIEKTMARIAALPSVSSTFWCAVDDLEG